MTPSGPPSALTSSTGGVVAAHRCLFILCAVLVGAVCVDVWCS